MHKLFRYAVDGERKSGESPDRVGGNKVYVRKPLWDQENKIKFDWYEQSITLYYILQKKKKKKGYKSNKVNILYVITSVGVR